MVSKVLIANRGEIAVRILRACRDLGLPAVVAYSEADRETLAVRLADEAICIGPAEARKSYLNQPAVISAAMITGCDRPSRLRVSVGGCHLRRGLRRARADLHRSAAGGSRAICVEVRRAAHACRQRAADRAGQPRHRDRPARRPGPGRRGRIPVLLKPSAGGGGRGMRLVRSSREMEQSLPLARSEAQAAFGDDSIYFEKWIEESRHVEVQVMVDRHGNGVHLGERDCSIQRRHQKLIEEVLRRPWTMPPATGCAISPSGA